MNGSPALPFLLVLLAGCTTSRVAELSSSAAPEQLDQVLDFRCFTAQVGPVSAPRLQFDRVTTAVPWPRGMVVVDGELVALARGRHRNAGGIDPKVADHSGTLYRVDPGTAEPVIRGREAGVLIRANAEIMVEPTGSPFVLYRPEAGMPIDQYLMDRPYCTLAYDSESANYFICGYSGVDLPAARFRKNATDSIHRYDTRTGRWSTVELHDGDTVAPEELDYVVSDEHYPHHDPAQNSAPHGWLNGPNGAWVVGRYLYAVGKDNHTLAQYDLSEIRANPEAGPPPSRVVMRDLVELELGGELREVSLLGHSALVARDGFLYVGYRTSSVVVRFPLDETGDLVGSHGSTLPRGELIAVFQPWTSESGESANLIDIRFNSRGELFVSCAQRGRVWNVGIPDPLHPFDGVDGDENPTKNRPFLDLRALTDNPRARTGNIAFDDRDRLFVCSGNYDSGTELAGVIYRAASL